MSTSERRECGRTEVMDTDNKCRDCEQESERPMEYGRCPECAEAHRESLERNGYRHGGRTWEGWAP